MTGFGRGTTSNKDVRYVAEARSVNNRYLESRVHGIREDFLLEFELHKLMKQKFHRGKFDLVLRKEELHSQESTLNEKQITEHYKNLQKLQKKLGFQEPLTFQTVLSTLPVKAEPHEDSTKLHPYFIKAAENALDALQISREKEGSVLAQDIKKRIDQILEWFKFIDERLPEIRERKKQEVKQKIEIAMEDSPVDPKRIETEMAFMIEKMDVTEEMVRFAKHLTSFDDLMGSPKFSGKSVGRELDFTMQEMNREINTLGAKIANIDVSKIVVNIKSEMEKIREQIQNIE